MKESDFLQKFILPQANIRGEIVQLASSYQTIIKQRNYPPLVKQLVGEALVANTLLTGSIKFQGNLSLQFQGEKPLSLLIVQCDHLLQLRAFAKYQEDLSDKDYAEAFLKGQMVLTINQSSQVNAHQSIVPIQSTSMSENLINYFAQSEQISTFVLLAANNNLAAGMLLQLMPGSEDLQREHFWEYAVHLGQTVSEKELLLLDTETLLYRLYHETEVRLFDKRKVSFQCRCTKEKMKEVLKVLGKEEAEHLLKEKENIEISCDFCNKHYSFDPIDIALLFHLP